MKIGRRIGLGETYVSRVESILQKAPQELIEKARRGQIRTNKAFNLVKKEEKRQQLLRESQNQKKLTDDIKLIHGDFRTCEIQDSSIDLIFTDPPYGQEHLPLYKDLGKLAFRVLKDGGMLITYFGMYALPYVLNSIQEEKLSFFWMGSIELSGPFDRFYPKGITIKWKPLLVFLKGEKRNTDEFVSDFVRSKASDKNLHEWEQSIVEAEHFIDGFTAKNQTVLDPLMGSGTTGIAAIKLDRGFIGIEKNSQRFEVAKANLFSCTHNQSTVKKDNECSFAKK